jgi:hypothetical protein
MRSCYLLPVLFISTALMAGDMVSQLTGEICSTHEVRRVVPVRYHCFGQELWLTLSRDWQEFRPVDFGQNAALRKDGRNTSWSWTISNSGGGPQYLADVVIQTDDATVYEVVEMNLPLSLYQSRDKPGIEEAEVRNAVPDAHQREFEKAKASCDALLLGRYPDFQVSQHKLMTYMEYQSTRSYLLHVQFAAAKNDPPTWAVVRITASPNHFRADIIRVRDDDEIQGHKTYQAIPYFTVGEESKSRRSKIDLDALKFPGCRIEESAQKP